MQDELFKELVNVAAKFKFMDIVKYKGRLWYVIDVRFKMVPNSFIRGMPEDGEWNLYEISYDISPARDNPLKSRRHGVLQKKLKSIPDE